jgi:hypothetical protein
MLTHPAFSLALIGSAVCGFGAEPTFPGFRAVDIDTQVKIGYAVAVADVDGDKQPDILLVDKDIVAWYRNPTWEKFVIAEKLTELDHVCIAAADINGDGKAEIAIGAGWKPSDTVNSGAVFYLIPPADRTQRWTPVRLPHEPTVHRMRWIQGLSGRYELVVVPLHGRGNQNGEGAGVRTLVYEVPDDPRQPWRTELVDNTLHLTHNFDVVQWDMDVAHELIIGGREGVYLFDRGPQAQWTRRRLVGDRDEEATPFLGAGEVRAGRLPSGRRFIATIEPMHGNQLAVYVSSSRNRSAWKRQLLDDSLIDGHAVACGDVLGVGSDQIVVGWRGRRPGDRVGIKLFASTDNTGGSWRSVLVDDNTMACEDLVLADLNGDGRLDIVAAGRATKNLKVYFNEGLKVSSSAGDSEPEGK